MKSETRQRKRSILAFVHIPKTAGTTLKFILRNSTWFRHGDLQTRVPHGVFDDADFRFMRKVFFLGLRSMAGHGLRHPTKHLSGPIEYFTILREPLARCLSQYEHIKRARLRRGQELSFEEYLELDRMRDSQVLHIAGEYNAAKAKDELSRYLFVGLTERFAESMLVLRELARHRLNLQFERRHVTKDKTASQRVLEDPAARGRLEEANQLDLELYAFARDELYPALREKAGITEGDVDESEFRLRSLGLRYRLTRGYNMWFYRNLAKLRREPGYKARR